MAMERQADPWNSIKPERRPEIREHPDVPGIYLNHYRLRTGLLMALWPADGPMANVMRDPMDDD